MLFNIVKRGGVEVAAEEAQIDMEKILKSDDMDDKKRR
jgi:hypothetical protein